MAGFVCGKVAAALLDAAAAAADVWSELPLSHGKFQSRHQVHGKVINRLQGQRGAPS